MAGRIVMLLGLWTAMLLMFIAALHVLDASRPITVGGLVQWTVGAVLCSLVLRWGVKLTRGHRNLVLFLRKFGNRDAITAVSRSVASAMKRRWRLITLDDSEIEPIGVPGTRHGVVAGLAGTGIVLMLANFDYFFGVEGIGLVAGYVLMALIHVTVTESNRALSAHTANVGKAPRLSNPAQLEKIAERVETLSRRVVAPPLMVVAVDEPIWQDAVCRLAAMSTTVLIDISEPTENLLWEIKTLRPEVQGQWAFICEENHFRQPARNEQEPDPRSQLDEMLAGEAVLLYSAIGSNELRRFSKALRRTLETGQPSIPAT